MKDPKNSPSWTIVSLVTIFFSVLAYLVRIKYLNDSILFGREAAIFFYPLIAALIFPVFLFMKNQKRKAVIVAFLGSVLMAANVLQEFLLTDLVTSYVSEFSLHGSIVVVLFNLLAMAVVYAQTESEKLWKNPKDSWMWLSISLITLLISAILPYAVYNAFSVTASILDCVEIVGYPLIAVLIFPLFLFIKRKRKEAIVTAAIGVMLAVLLATDCMAGYGIIPYMPITLNSSEYGMMLLLPFNIIVIAVMYLKRHNVKIICAD